MSMRFLTKDQMTERLQELAKTGWIKSVRPLNSGGIGNTIDSLLGLPENNLPISDTAQWELKTHRQGSSSLLTLFHMEPEPRSHKVVINMLLPLYGWPDQTRPNEMSFRQTIQSTHVSDRGFRIVVDHSERRNQILTTSINAYINSATPVSSEVLAKIFDFSPATVRNVLAELEDTGYLTHPHTSAGRIPTEKGYRYYVDFLMSQIELLDDEKKRIINEYKTRIETLEDALEKTSELISTITHYAGIVSA